MDVYDKDSSRVKLEDDEISKFVDSYESFNRVIGALERRYMELEKEFTAQNRELAEANRKLVELTARNIAATEFLDSLLNSITAGVVAIDTSGYITHFNKAASQIFGILPEESLGKHYNDCIPSGEPSKANVLHSMENTTAIDSVERKITLADGTNLSLSVSTTILCDSEGRTTGGVEVIHDLTKIKKMEQELARLNTLAALGEMAATIAHEVRNPLSGIAGFASLLQNDLSPSDPRQKLVEKIIRGTSILNETITTLLNYTRFEETNKKEINWINFLQTTIEQFRRDNPDRVKDVHILLSNNQDAQLQAKTVLVDPVLFRQIFFNLFNNAIEAFSNTGTIKISTCALPRQTALDRYSRRLLLGLDETIVETTVTDNGPGIKPEHRERIFAPFFTDRAEGNGLGLAVVWKIIKAHSGDIIAENSSEGGAVFRLLLPVRLDTVYMERLV